MRPDRAELVVPVAAGESDDRREPLVCGPTSDRDGASTDAGRHREDRGHEGRRSGGGRQHEGGQRAAQGSGDDLARAPARDEAAPLVRTEPIALLGLAHVLGGDGRRIRINGPSSSRRGRGRRRAVVGSAAGVPLSPLATRQLLRRRPVSRRSRGSGRRSSGLR